MTVTDEHTPRPRVGRPLRLTRRTLDTVVAAVEQGSYLKIAAQAAGVSQSTLAAWLARGRAAAQLAADHADDPRYCPACGEDRTDDLRARDAEQDRLDDEHADLLDRLPYGQPEPPRPTAALPPCDAEVVEREVDGQPQAGPCGSTAEPDRWTLPDEEAPFLELLDGVTRAQASAEVAAVTAWRTAFVDDWRAARDYLSRTAPERWAGVTRVQMTTEEAERRIDDAVNEALTALGVDALGDDDPAETAAEQGEG